MHLPQDVRIKVAKAQLGRGRAGEADEAAAIMPAPAAAPVAASGAMLAAPSVETDIPPAPRPPVAELPAELFGQSLKDCKEAVEQRYMEALVRRAGGDVQRALSASGLSRSHLYALLKKWSLSIDGPAVGS